MFDTKAGLTLRYLRLRPIERSRDSWPTEPYTRPEFNAICNPIFVKWNHENTGNEYLYTENVEPFNVNCDWSVKEFIMLHLCHGKSMGHNWPVTHAARLYLTGHWLMTDDHPETYCVFVSVRRYVLPSHTRPLIQLCSKV